MAKRYLVLDAEKHAQEIVRCIVDCVDRNGELDPAKESELVESVATSLRGFAKAAHPGRFSTCEGCNKQVSVAAGDGLPSNWTQLGKSRFKGQDLGEWCPDCIRIEERKDKAIAGRVED